MPFSHGKTTQICNDMIMDNTNWRSSSSSTNNHQTVYLLKSFSEHPYGRFEPPPRRHEPPTTTTTTTTRSTSSTSSSRSSKMQGLFRKLRRKFRKEKKVFGSSHSDLVIVPYNSYTYSKNFDDKDLALAEPDNLSRSFSARFAASSTGMLKRVQTVR